MPQPGRRLHNILTGSADRALIRVNVQVVRGGATIVTDRSNSLFEWASIGFNGVKFRKPFCTPCQWAGDDELEGSGAPQRDVIEQAGNSALMPKARPKPPLRRVRSYLAAKRATSDRERTVAFDEELWRS